MRSHVHGVDLTLNHEKSSFGGVSASVVGDTVKNNTTFGTVKLYFEFTDDSYVQIGRGEYRHRSPNPPTISDYITLQRLITNF